jgi:sec-independent protein translocase protein TatA
MLGITLFLGGIGGWEVFLILVVFLVLFGAKKIPELARGLGRGIREFKDATKEIKDELEEGLKEDNSKKINS